METVDPYNHYKIIAETIASSVTAVGVVVGAFWVYLKFIRTREGHSKIEFDLEIKVIGRQDGVLLIEVIALLQNKGLVRHWIKNFTASVMILQRGHKVEQGDKRINYQVLFTKYNPIQGDDSSRDKRIVWIPAEWEGTFIDSGVKQMYTYLTSVPDDTTFISIYSQFWFKSTDFQTAQRTFSVEQLENVKSKEVNS